MSPDLAQNCLKIVIRNSWHGPCRRGQSPRRYGVNVVAHNPCFPVTEGRNQLHRELVVALRLGGHRNNSDNTVQCR